MVSFSWANAGAATDPANATADATSAPKNNRFIKIPPEWAVINAGGLAAYQLVIGQPTGGARRMAKIAAARLGKPAARRLSVDRQSSAPGQCRSACPVS